MRILTDMEAVTDKSDNEVESNNIGIEVVTDNSAEDVETNNTGIEVVTYNTDMHGY